MQTLRRMPGHAAPIWGATPPPPRVRKYPVLHVVSATPLDLLIVNEQLEETWTHYVDKRTVFCTGPEAGCWLDHSTTGKSRYGAWLAVQEVRTPIVFLLRMTSVAVSLEPRLRELAGKLRGRHLQVWRTRNTEAAEMGAKLLPAAPVREQLSPSPDVRFCVERMLCADDRAHGPKEGRFASSRATIEHLGGKHPQLRS